MDWGWSKEVTIGYIDMKDCYHSLSSTFSAYFSNFELFELKDVLCDCYYSCLDVLEDEMNIWCRLHSGAPDSVRVASCCSQSLLFISSEYRPSAALSACCLLPPSPASKVFSPAPRRAVIIPSWRSWNPHRQAHCHICICGQHSLVREWRELYELTHVRYYATIICRRLEHRSNSPVNNWRIKAYVLDR